MNEQAIDYALHARCRGKFIGVFACNRLPKNLPARRPLILVANTDPSHKLGSHWVVLYIDSKGEYFDSLGRPPEQEIFKRYLDKFCMSWTYNNKQLQSAISYFCGQYCILFSLYRSLDYSMKDILGMFSTDTGLNDFIAHGFFHHIG